MQLPVDVEECSPGDAVEDVDMLMMGVGRGWRGRCGLEKWGG